MRPTVVGTPHPCRCLLLGASGLVGRMLRAHWQKMPPQGLEITPVFRMQPEDAAGALWSRGQSVQGLPACDVIAALWGVKEGSPDELAQNSALGVAAMELGQALGARLVLHASSAAVYQPGPDPLDETSHCAPPSAYGAAKLAMERAVTQWQERHPQGPKAGFLRIGNVAGADSLFLNLRPGGRIRLDQFTDGTAPARSYIAPRDLAGAIEALCLSELTGPVNLCAPVATGMDQITLAGGGAIDWSPAPTTALPRVQLDTSRLRSVYPMDESTAEASYLVRSAQDTGVWP